MEIYIIIAVSFAIMYTFKYSYQICRTVQDTLDMFDIDYSETSWSPNSYYIAAFAASAIMMPLFLLDVIFNNRWLTINSASKRIIDKHFSKYFKK